MAHLLILNLLLLGALQKLPAETVIFRVIPSESVRLRDPSAISLAADGSILITDSGNHRVIAVNRQGDLLSEIGSFGNESGEFQWPRDVAAESGLAIWIADYGNRRIVKLSRRFEIQAYYTVESEQGSRPEQIGKITVSPQGDLYLYSEDSGRLLRFDPLFVRQGVLGSSTGSDFIPGIRQLIFVPSVGVVWHSRGDELLYKSDPLLTSMQHFDIGLQNYNDYVFCANDSCIIAAGMSGIYRYCFDGDGLVELTDSATLTDAGISQITDIAFVSDSSCIILDSKSNALYSIHFDSH